MQYPAPLALRLGHFRTESGREDDRQLRSYSFQFVGQSNATHPGHHYVGEDEIATGNRFVEALRAAITREDESAEVVIFSAKVEAELAELPPEDRKDFLDSLGVHESGLDRLAHAAYHLLGLQSYFTAGEKEVRAWTIHSGDKAPAAAGVIHSDFEKGFIRAETVAYQDFVRVGGWKPAREQGLSRAEGKEYVVQDGDVHLFRLSS